MFVEQRGDAGKLHKLSLSGAIDSPSLWCDALGTIKILLLLCTVVTYHTRRHQEARVSPTMLVSCQALGVACSSLCTRYDHMYKHRQLTYMAASGVAPEI